MVPLGQNASAPVPPEQYKETGSKVEPVAHSHTELQIKLLIHLIKFKIIIQVKIKSSQ